MEGAYRCMWQRERKKEREIDRKKDSTERTRETAWQLSPWGVGSFLWASFWFFSFLPNPLPPCFYFSESRPMCFLWALAASAYLPTPSLPPSHSLWHFSLHFFSGPLRHVAFILPPLSWLPCLSTSLSFSPTFGPRCLEDLPINFSSSSSHCSSRSKMSSSYTPTHTENTR